MARKKRATTNTSAGGPRSKRAKTTKNEAKVEEDHGEDEEVKKVEEETTNKTVEQEGEEEATKVEKEKDVEDSTKETKDSDGGGGVPLEKLKEVAEEAVMEEKDKLTNNETKKEGAAEAAREKKEEEKEEEEGYYDEIPKEGGEDDAKDENAKISMTYESALELSHEVMKKYKEELNTDLIIVGSVARHLPHPKDIDFLTTTPLENDRKFVKFDAKGVKVEIWYCPKENVELMKNLRTYPHHYTIALRKGLKNKGYKLTDKEILDPSGNPMEFKGMESLAELSGVVYRPLSHYFGKTFDK